MQRRIRLWDRHRSTQHGEHTYLTVHACGACDTDSANDCSVTVSWGAITSTSAEVHFDSNIDQYDKYMIFLGARYGNFETEARLTTNI